VYLPVCAEVFREGCYDWGGKGVSAPRKGRMV